MKEGIGFAPLVLAWAVAACGAAGAPPRVAPAVGGPGGPGAHGGPPAAAEWIYVTIQDDAAVAVIDPRRHEVVRTVALEALGFSAHARPHHVVAEPDGSYWYVSLIGANRVLKFDANDRLVAQVEFDVPGMLDLDLASNRLFVGRSMTAVNPPPRIGIIDRTDMRLVEEIDVFFPRPHALIAHPTSGHVYSASLATNRMAAIEPATERVRLGTFDAGEATRGANDDPARHEHHDHADHGSPPGMVHTLVDFAVSPDGRTLVGTGEMSGRLLVFDLSDPAEPRYVRQVRVGARPWRPVFSPDGRHVWVPNHGDHTISVVDARAWTVESVVRGHGLAEPYGSATSGDGRWIFVSNTHPRGGHPGAGGTVVVVDAETHQVVKVIEVGRNPTGVGTRARP